MFRLNSLLFVCLLAGAALLAGCSDKDGNGDPKEFKVQNRDALKQNLYADETGGKSVTFTTTGAWTSSIAEKTAKSTASLAWISINPDSGDEAGTYTVTVILAKNTTGADRTAEITFTCNGDKITVSVTQKAETEDGEIPEEDEPTEYTETKTFTITSLEGLMLQWADIDQAAENKNFKVVIDWKKMGVYQTYIDVICGFIADRYLMDNVFINLEGFWPSEEGITITFDDWVNSGKWPLLDDGGFKWTVSAEDKEKFENDEIGKLYLDMMYDPYADAIDVSNPQALEQTLDAEDTQAESLTFTTTAAWTASIEPETAASWLTIHPQSGAAAGTYTVGITLAINSSEQARMATITFNCDGMQKSANITQNAATPEEEEPDVITVSNPQALEQTLDAEDTQGESLTFTTAAAWTASIVPTTSWLSVSPQSGAAGTHNLAITLTANTTDQDRTAAIKIASGGKEVTVNMTQKAATGDAQTSEITMATKSASISMSLKGTGSAIIDWGDGTPTLTKTLSSDTPTDVQYTYSAANERTIKITGENLIITNFSCNSLISLDVSKCTALTYLAFTGTLLTSLDVSKNTALTELYCEFNQLTSLDVSSNTKLTMLHCGSNQLTSLDVSSNTKLTMLYCQYNQLTSLDLRTNTVLSYVMCSNNQLSAPALNALFGTLHSNSVPEGRKEISIGGNPGYGGHDASIAESRGWIVDWH